MAASRIPIRHRQRRQTFSELSAYACLPGLPAISFAQPVGRIAWFSLPALTQPRRLYRSLHCGRAKETLNVSHSEHFSAPTLHVRLALHSLNSPVARWTFHMYPAKPLPDQRR